MSLKRILGLTLSLLDLIIIIAIFLPFDSTGNFMAVYKPAAILLIVMNAIGFILGAVGFKAEINFTNTGATLFFTGYLLLNSMMNNVTAQFFQNVGISFYVMFIGSIFALIGTILYSFSKDDTSKKNSAPVISKAGGIQQRTNCTYQANGAPVLTCLGCREESLCRTRQIRGSSRSNRSAESVL